MREKRKSLLKQLFYAFLISFFVCSIYFYNFLESTKKIEDKSKEITTISNDVILQTDLSIDKQIDELLYSLKNDANNQNLLLKLAILYSKKGLYSISAEQLIKAQKLDPRNPKILNELGVSYYYLSFYDKALNIFEDLNNSYNNDEYKLNLAFVFYKKGAFDKSLQLLERIDLKAYNNYEIPLLAANIHVEENNISQAINYYKKSISLNPNLANIHYNLGILLAQINSNELAIQELETAKRLDKSDPLIKFELADLYNKEEKLIEAKNIYFIATSGNDNIISSKAYSKLGSIYYHEGLYSNSIEVLRKSISLFNNNFDSLFNLGNIFYDIGQTKKSLYFFEQAKKISPSDINLNFNLANLYFDLKNYRKASAIWKEYINISSIDEYTAYKISKSFYENKEFDIASEFAVKTTELDPINLEYKINLGNIYLAAKKTDDAIKQYNYCLNSNPSYNFLNKTIGIAYYNYGNFNEAISYLNKYIEKNNNDFSVYDVVGEIYLSNNDIDTTLHYWNQANKINQKFLSYKLKQYKSKQKKLSYIDSEKFLLLLLEIDGTNTDIRLNLANLYKQNNDIYKAINQWENIVNIDYDNNQALENLSGSLLDQGDLQEATKYLKRLLSVNPYNIFASKNLAKLYFTNNNFNKVIEILQPVISSKVKDQEVLYMYAVSLKNTGDTYAAINIFNKIIKINSKSIYATDSQTFISEIKINNENTIEERLSSTDLYTKTIEEANRYSSLGSFNMAINKYKEAININPDYKEPYFSIISILKAQGKLKEAQNFAQKHNLN